MLAASRRPHNPNRTIDDIGWDSGDLSSFLRGVDINGKIRLNNDIKLSNKSIKYYQTSPKSELAAEIIRTFNHNQLNLLNGIYHIQKCNDRLIQATKNRNKAFIQLNNKIKNLETRQNTLYSLLFKAMHPLPANDIISADLNDGILEPTKTPLKQSQSHTIPLVQFDNHAPKQTQQPNKQIINNKIIIKAQSADLAKNIVEFSNPSIIQTPDSSFKINNNKIQISNTSQQTQPSSTTQSMKSSRLINNLSIVDELSSQTKLKTQTIIMKKVNENINISTHLNTDEHYQINNNKKQTPNALQQTQPSTNKPTITVHPLNDLSHVKNINQNKYINNKINNNSQSKTSNSVQLPTNKQLKATQINKLNSIPIDLHNKTESPIPSNKPSIINTLRQKRKLLNKPQLNHNIKITKQKKKKIKNNNKQKNKIKKHQKNKKRSIINKKNKNNLNNNKKQLIPFKNDEFENKNQLNNFTNDELENYIINHKFTDDQFDDWTDYKKNIKKNITAKEYYELLNGKIIDTLIKEWFSTYHSNKSK